MGGAGGATVAGVSVVVVLLLFSLDSSSFLVTVISASALLCTSELLLDLCLAAVAEPEAPIANAVRVVNMKSVERNMWSFASWAQGLAIATAEKGKATACAGALALMESYFADGY